MPTLLNDTNFLWIRMHILRIGEDKNGRNEVDWFWGKYYDRNSKGKR
jgi:hypothetical protein